MKPINQTWTEYLAEGVQLMEGVHPDYPGYRHLPRAQFTFEDCAEQTEDTKVSVLGHYRRVQCALYQSDMHTANTWLDRATTAYQQAGHSQDILPQCQVIVASALIHMHRYTEAESVLQLAWKQAQATDDSKLRGDIANMRGRLYSRCQPASATKREARQLAAEWFVRAVAEFAVMPNPDALAHHAWATAAGHAGLALQLVEGYRSPRAQIFLSEAEHLFTTTVTDPCVRGTFWRNRAKVALRLWHMLKALKFFIQAIKPTLQCRKQIRYT